MPITFYTFRLIAIIILIKFANSKLSTQENLDRLQECGKSELEISTDGSHVISFENRTFMVRVQTLNHTEFTTSGVFISPRHVVTNSQSILDKDRRWIANTTEGINKENCTLQVPSKYVKEIRVIWDNRIDYSKTEGLLKVKDAFVFANCRTDLEDFNRYRSMLILELEKDQKNVLFPCIPDNSTVIQIGETVHAYGFKHENGGKITLTQYERTIRQLDPDLLDVEGKAPHAGQRGGPLLKYKTSVGTLLLGPDASTGHADLASMAYFHDIRQFDTEICNIFGVCPAVIPLSTSSTVTESTVTKPSESTFSESSTIEIETTKSVKISTDKKAPNRKEEDEECTENDDDYEQEDFDANNDFFVSEDFMFKGGLKSWNNWIVVLIMCYLLG